MMTTFNLAPVPRWYFRDAAGVPLANGTMLAFRDTNRSELKAVFQDAAGTLAYVQPIQFDAAGSQGPFYWASDENYFLELFDADGSLVWTIPGFNAPQDGSIIPVTTNIDFINYIGDAQFDYITSISFTTLKTFQKIGSTSWFFTKTNTSATDQILMVPFAPGSTTPPNDPHQYFSYQCSVAGAGETTKDLEWRFPSVFSFENREVSIALFGQSATAANQVEVIARQHFGTGGAPSPDVETAFTTFALGVAWAQFMISGVPPNISGKTLGTNGDDYLSITFRLPRDVITTIDLENIQLNDGNVLFPFEYVPFGNVPSRTIPEFDATATSFRGTVLTIDNDGIMGWFAGLPIGALIPWVGMDSLTVPTGFERAQGQSLLVADFPELFALTGFSFGGSGLNFNLIDMRGMWVRGYDDGRGSDPGRAWGSFQNDALQEHRHDLNFQTDNFGAGNVTLDHIGTGLSTNTEGILPDPGVKVDSLETRVKNMALDWLVKLF